MTYLSGLRSESRFPEKRKGTGQLQAGNRAISYQYCASDLFSNSVIHITRRVINYVASTNGKGNLTSKSQQWASPRLTWVWTLRHIANKSFQSHGLRIVGLVFFFLLVSRPPSQNPRSRKSKIYFSFPSYLFPPTCPNPLALTAIFNRGRARAAPPVL